MYEDNKYCAAILLILLNGQGEFCDILLCLHIKRVMLCYSYYNYYLVLLYYITTLNAHILYWVK